MNAYIHIIQRANYETYYSENNYGNDLFNFFQPQKNNYLEIKFNDRNQVYDKIVWGLVGEFLSFH